VIVQIGLCRGHILLVDSQHSCEPFIPEVDVVGVHLVEHEVVAVVALGAQLCLNLIEVDRLVLLFALLLQFELVRTLPPRVFDAALARFPFLTDCVGRTALAEP